MPISSRQWRTERASRWRRASSSGLTAAWRFLRPFSCSARRVSRVAVASISRSEPGHWVSVLAISSTCLIDSAPLAAASLVAGMSCKHLAACSSRPASPHDVPLTRPNQSAGSVKPDCRCAPASAAFAAAMARSVAQAFSVLASSSTSSTHVCGEIDASSRRDSSARYRPSDDSTPNCPPPPDATNALVSGGGPSNPGHEVV
jgi:hypothetical protein